LENTNCSWSTILELELFTGSIVFWNETVEDETENTWIEWDSCKIENIYLPSVTEGKKEIRKILLHFVLEDEVDYKQMHFWLQWQTMKMKQNKAKQGE
jgi:hypothetical protein